MIIAAREIRNAPSAAIVAGDLDDVPWSATTQLFKKVSETIGRGFLASITTEIPVMRWPLDHIFVTRSFQVMEFAGLPDVGSDHFPVQATRCCRDAIDTAADREALNPATRQFARQVIQSGREAANK